MTRSRTSSCPPDQILEGSPLHVRQAAQRLRALLRRIAPDLEEAGRPGWRLIGYRRHGYVCFIAPLADEVRLGFEHGVQLADPARRLQGNGTQVRYLAYARAEDVDEELAAGFVTAALMDDAQRAALRKKARPRAG